MADERKGVAWKQVQASSLTEDSLKLYHKYVKDFQGASQSAKTLKEAVSAEWNKKFPDGMDGKVCVFNAIGGVLNYAWIDKTKSKATKSFDVTKGDNVFAR